MGGGGIAAYEIGLRGMSIAGTPEYSRGLCVVDGRSTDMSYSLELTTLKAGAARSLRSRSSVTLKVSIELGPTCALCGAMALRYSFSVETSFESIMREGCAEISHHPTLLERFVRRTFNVYP